MEKIKEAFRHFEVVLLIKPLFASLILSVLYNIGYIFTLLYQISYTASYIIQIVLSLLSSIGLYWICQLVWHPDAKEKITGKALVGVVLIQALVIISIQGILVPLWMQTLPNLVLNLLVSFVCALYMIFGYPIILTAYYALSIGIDQPKKLIAFVMEVMQRKGMKLANWFCLLFIVIIVIDTLWWGMFSMNSGFLAGDLLSRMFFMANPMMNWMMYMLACLLQQVSLSASWVTIFICFTLGFFYALLELNYCAFVKRQEEEYGTGCFKAD